MTRSGFRSILARVTWVAGAAAVAATLLPFLRTDWWWVRILDFPRLQVAALAAVSAIGAILVLERRRRRVQAFVILLVASLGYQASEVYPFTFLAAEEVKAAPACDPSGRLSLLIANVLMTNRRAEPFLRLVRLRDPDVIVVTETDRWWDAQLQRLAPRYPHAVRYPLENTYGIHLYSKLPLEAPEVRFLVQPGVPSIHARLRLRSGTLVEFHAVHPTPPQPQRDTTPRDVELILVGLQVNGDGRPTVVAGDLNDVGWSQTTRRFQDISGLLDPRVGRGLYATFNANWPLLRWPLDHVFVDRSFRLVRLRREGDIGSDHFPIYVELCREPGRAPAPERRE